MEDGFEWAIREIGQGLAVAFMVWISRILRGELPERTSIRQRAWLAVQLCFAAGMATAGLIGANPNPVPGPLLATFLSMLALGFFAALILNPYFRARSGQGGG